MDHPCPSCGRAVADGTPFCSGCRAPQIRFVLPEPVIAQEPADTASLDAPLPIPTPLVWRRAFHAALVGGVFSALVMNVLFGLFGLGFVAGGALAVYAYRRRVPGAVVNLGSGATLGAASGFLGFLIFSVLLTLEILITHRWGELRQAVIESMNQTARNADPQFQQQLQDAIVQFKTPEGFAMLMAFTGVFLCLIFIFFSVLGGAIGSSMTRKSPK